MTTADLAAIEDVARGELARAFAGLPIRVTARRDATYRVRVVQAVHDPRMRGRWGVAGASYAVPGLGGQGEVSFDFLAGGATAQAPEQATRADIVAAIGRGIGRTAVHELTHQLLPQAPIHDSRGRAQLRVRFRGAARAVLRRDALGPGAAAARGSPEPLSASAPGVVR